MPPGRPCRHHAQAGAGPAAAFMLFGGDLYGMAAETFINIVQLAEKIEAICSDVVRYGLASMPICGMSKDAAWKAMPSPCASRRSARSSLRVVRKAP